METLTQEHIKTKYYKDEKYIYLLMGYHLAKNNSGYFMVGKDDGYIGGASYWRSFRIQIYEGQEILTETKNSRHFAAFSRSFVVVNGDKEKPLIKDYINEYGENSGQCWTH
jgi:hypothetical protein